MRIQVDARLLLGGGIGRYIREITGPWMRRADVEGVRFFGNPHELGPWLEGEDVRGIGEIVSWPDLPYSPKSHARWPLIQRRLQWGADVTFFPHYDVPLWAHPSPSLVTIHDLIHFQEPEGFTALKRLAGGALMSGAVRRATRIATISRATQRALVERYPKAAGKVRVVANGVSNAFVPLAGHERIAAGRKWIHLTPFCLTVGPAKAHKNLITAVRAVALARQHRPELQLAMVGLRARDAASLTSALAAETPWIHDLGMVDDEGLRELYSLCEAFLSPSRLEGFGLPMAEARACGARVLAADTEVSREVIGSDAVLLDPDDAPAWCREVLEPTAQRVAEGEQGTQGRSWEDASRDTLELVMEVAGAGD